MVLNTVNTNNSSTATVANGATWTGVPTDVSLYNSLVFSVKTDQSGILYVEFSPDGTNWDSILSYSVSAGISKSRRLTITRKWARLRFTNNSGAEQTYFRLQTSLGDYIQLTSVANTSLQQDSDTIAIREAVPYKYDVALGKRNNQTLWNAFGYNDDLDIGTEIVAQQGGTLTILTTASTLTIVSSSTNDITSTGSGARSLILYGIDENRESQLEVVQLNGTTNVVTTSTWLGINRAAIYICGASQLNEGDITITATTGGSVQAYIPTGVGTTQQLIFFTQASHTALADWLILNAQKISGGGNPKVTFKGWVYSAVSNGKYEVFRKNIDTASVSEIQLTPSQPFVIGEKSVFYIECTTDTNNSVVSGRFSLIEIKNI